MFVWRSRPPYRLSVIRRATEPKVIDIEIILPFTLAKLWQVQVASPLVTATAHKYQLILFLGWPVFQSQDLAQSSARLTGPHCDLPHIKLKSRPSVCLSYIP